MSITGSGGNAGEVTQSGVIEVLGAARFKTQEALQFIEVFPIHMETLFDHRAEFFPERFVFVRIFLRECFQKVEHQLQ
jgi:hypothetical protein